MLFSEDEIPLVRKAIDIAPRTPPNARFSPYEMVNFSALQEEWQDVFGRVALRMKQCLETHYGASVQHRPFPHGTIFRAGDSQDQHPDLNTNFDQLDFGKYMIEHDSFPYDYTTLVYLADDFVGGDLVFSELGIRISPRFGNFLMFECWPPGINLHGVEPVLSGQRICGVTFWPRLKGTGGAQDKWLDFRGKEQED